MSVVVYYMKSIANKFYPPKHVGILFPVYRWINKVLVQLDIWFQNFIWRGVVLTRKMCIVA